MRRHASLAFIITLLFSQLAVLIVFEPSVVKANPDLESLYVDGFDSTATDWTEVGAAPYLTDSDTNSITYAVEDVTGIESWFSFADSSGTDTINSVTLYVEIMQDNGGDEQITFSLQATGLGDTDVGTLTPNTGSYSWQSIDVSAHLDSWAKIDSAELKVTSAQVGGKIKTLYVRRAYLNVDYSPVGETYSIDSSHPVTVAFSKGETWTAKQQFSFNPNVGFTETFNWATFLTLDWGSTIAYTENVEWTTSLTLDWVSTVAYTEQADAVFPLALSTPVTIGYTEQTVWSAVTVMDYSPSVDYTEQTDWATGVSVSFNPNVDYVEQTDWTASITFDWQPNVNYETDDGWAANLLLTWNPTLTLQKQTVWQTTATVNFQPSLSYVLDVLHSTGGQLYQVVLDFASNIGWSTDTSWTSKITFSWAPSISYAENAVWATGLPSTFNPNINYAEENAWFTNIGLSLNPNVDYDEAEQWRTTITFHYLPDIQFAEDTGWSTSVTLTFNPNMDYSITFASSALPSESPPGGVTEHVAYGTYFVYAPIGQVYTSETVNVTATLFDSSAHGVASALVFMSKSWDRVTLSAVTDEHGNFGLPVQMPDIDGDYIIELVFSGRGSYTTPPYILHNGCTKQITLSVMSGSQPQSASSPDYTLIGGVAVIVVIVTLLILLILKEKGIEQKT